MRITGYFAEASLYALATYAMIHLHSRTAYHLEKTFKPADHVSKEEGLYINKHYIPLSKLTPNEEITLRYSQVPLPQLGMEFLVNNKDTRVEIYAEGVSEKTLEARLDAAAKGKEGIDGIAIRGSVYSNYLLVVTVQNPIGQEPLKYMIRVIP